MTGGWRIAIRNLRRNRRRNGSTGLAIALGYAALVVLGGYAHRIDGLLRTVTVYLQHVGHLSVHKPGGFVRGSAKPAAYSFGPEEQRAVEAALAGDRRVEFSERMLQMGGLAGNGCRSSPFRAVGLDLAAERRVLAHAEVRRWAPELGRPLAGVPITESAGVESPIALSSGLAAALGKRAGGTAASGPGGALDCAAAGTADLIAADPIVQLAGFDFEGGLAALDATTVALYRAPTYEEDKASIVTDLATLQRLAATDRVGSWAVYLRDPRDAAAVARDLSGRLAAWGIPAELRRYDEADTNPYYVGSMEFIDALVGFIGILVVAVALLSVLNAMTLTILERTRELATFRSLGFTRRQVLGLFLREAAVLTAAGVAAGLVVALLAVAAVNGSGVRYSPPGVSAPIPLLIIPTPGLLAGLAAAYFPLSLFATWLAVRRQIARPVAGLLTAVGA